MEAVYVGLDVGSTVGHVVALDERGRTIRDWGFAMNADNLVRSVAELPGDVHVHLESSTLAGWVRRVLLTRAKVARVVVGHAKTSSWIAKDPLKNDRLDAYKLAALLRDNRVHPVYYPDDPHRETFKRIVQYHEQLTTQVVRIKTQIKARLMAEGVIVKDESVYTAAGRATYLSQLPPPAAREEIEQRYTLLDETEKAKKRAYTLMVQEGKKYPEIGRFREVPGIGPVGACRFSAYIQTPERFATKQKLWRYCRLGITDRSSDGKPLGRRRLDRNGHGSLKDLSRKAFAAALKTREENQFQRGYRAALSRTQDKTHARLTTQRKILTVLWAMWKGGANYQDDKG